MSVLVMQPQVQFKHPRRFRDLKPNAYIRANLNHSSVSCSISLTWSERQCDPVFEPFQTPRDFKRCLTFSSHNLQLSLDTVGFVKIK